MPPACRAGPVGRVIRWMGVRVDAQRPQRPGPVRDRRILLYHFHTTQPPRAWPAAAGLGIYIPLVADPLRLLVPAGHALSGQPAASLAEVADDRWIHGWGEVGDVTDMLAALSGFRPQVACRSSDYRFMSALVGAGVGVALVPSVALTGSPLVRDLPITPSPPATSAPGSPDGTSQTRPQSGCWPHCALAPSLYPRPRPDTADIHGTARPGTGPPGLSLRLPPQIDCSERHERLVTQA